MNERVEILRMSYGSDAIARLSTGKTVFVKGGIPGNFCEIEITEEKSSYCKARVSKFISGMIENSAFKNIPGMNWAHLPYDLQLSQKQLIIQDALLRYAKLSNENVANALQQIIPSQKVLNYRNKIELAYHNQMLGMHDEDNAFVRTPEVTLADEKIAEMPRQIEGALKFALGDENCGLHRVAIRSSSNTDDIEIALWTDPGWFPRAEVVRVLFKSYPISSLVRVVADRGKIRKVKSVEVLDGKGFWNEKLCDNNYKVSAPSFFQINSRQSETMQEIVMKFISGMILKDGETADVRVADLYCGCGAFTIPLAKKGFNVVGVELAGSSTRDLKRNLMLNNVEANIVCDEVERFLLKERYKFSACIVDPPASGLNKGVISKLIDMQPKGIVYVSCDPMTLARDLAQLTKGGYTLEVIQPIDMFPQTHHIETISLLKSFQR